MKALITILLIWPMVVFGLTGCFGAYVTSSVPEQVDAAMATIQPQETTRDMIRELLGKPIISSDLRRIEVYRPDAGHNIGLLYFIAPVEIESVIGYTLVVYDENQRVKDFSYDVFVEGEHELHLHADGYTLVLGDPYSSKPSETLISPKTLGNQLQRLDTSNEECNIILIGQGDDYDIYLDGKKLLDISHVHWREYFSFTVPPGEHELVLKKHWPGLFNSQPPYTEKFSCSSGQHKFVYTFSHFKRLLITVSEELINSTQASYRRIIYHQGKWWTQH